MNEIYWITRLDMVKGWLLAFVVISGIILIVSVIVTVINNVILKTSTWENDIRDAEGTNAVFKHVRKYSGIAFFIVLPLCILTPTKTEALMIYGVGGTIDYIKSNDTINQLPDKCVKALDAWVDSLTESESKDEK